VRRSRASAVDISTRPTQAQRQGLNGPPSVLIDFVAWPAPTTPLKPTTGLNGAPSVLLDFVAWASPNNPAQANNGLERGTVSE